MPEARVPTMLPKHINCISSDRLTASPLSRGSRLSDARSAENCLTFLEDSAIVAE